uniref:General transcription and DNA repair factor IIH subunit TFB5 n=1 Tax=Parastrongyloides trichosuri TaxID=131310 RepID=A0A0N4ZQJ3_PARTI
MVNVSKGVFITTDPAVREFLIHLDRNRELGRPFIIQKLSDRHLLIDSDMLPILKERFDKLMEANSPDQYEKQ